MWHSMLSVQVRVSTRFVLAKLIYFPYAFYIFRYYSAYIGMLLVELMPTYITQFNFINNIIARKNTGGINK